MGAIQVMLGKHLRLSLMGVFIGIRITGNNTCNGGNYSNCSNTMNKLSLISFKIGGCKTTLDRGEL